MIVDRLKSLAVFAEIVREGSFRAAARKLKFTPSAVSYHLKILEDEAGCPLLYRSTRSLSMTAAGETLYRSAIEMMNAAQTGFNEISGDQRELRGNLRIALTSALSHSFISQTIAHFLKLHPLVDVLLHYDNQQNDLIGERFDLALRTGKLDDANLMCRAIWSMPRTLVASPAYLDTTKTPRHAKELEYLAWVKFERLEEERILFDTQGKSIPVQLAGKLTVNSVEAMVDMTLQGVGISSPPAHYVSELIDKGDLVHLLPEWTVSDIPVFAIWPVSKVENPLTRSFLKLLSQNE